MASMTQPAFISNLAGIYTLKSSFNFDNCENRKNILKGSLLDQHCNYKPLSHSEQWNYIRSALPHLQTLLYVEISIWIEN